MLDRMFRKESYVEVIFKVWRKEKKICQEEKIMREFFLFKELKKVQQGWIRMRGGRYDKFENIGRDQVIDFYRQSGYWDLVCQEEYQFMFIFLL